MIAILTYNIIKTEKRLKCQKITKDKINWFLIIFQQGLFSFVNRFAQLFLFSFCFIYSYQQRYNRTTCWYTVYRRWRELSGVTKADNFTNSWCKIISWWVMMTATSQYKNESDIFILKKFKRIYVLKTLCFLFLGIFFFYLINQLSIFI